MTKYETWADHKKNKKKLHRHALFVWSTSRFGYLRGAVIVYFFIFNAVVR